MRKTMMMVALAFAFTGCAVQKVASPIGGSRSDGTVRMGYTVGLFEKPVVDWNQAARTAAQRCAAWGYSDAQAFGSTTSRCIGTDYNGACNMWQVEAEFQCMGQPEATSRAEQ
jgi:hypothetical protein